MIISVGAGNTFDKIQYPFLIKILRKIGVEEEWRRIGMLQRAFTRTSSKHYLMGKGLMLSPKIENRARMSPPLLFKRYSKFKIELKG